MSKVWSDLHKHYKDKDWIDKPSIFAETAIKYFPKNAKILELGAGQAQDSRFFADNGLDVVSTDIEKEAQQIVSSKLNDEQKKRISFEIVDVRDGLSYGDESFDVVYAHLSIHYFDWETTKRLVGDIYRVLKPGGKFAFFVNSVNDPEYKDGNEIEKYYFQIDKTKKRYFSVESARELSWAFDVNLLDDLGETYKDAAKGVHNLIRFVGTKPVVGMTYKTAVPYVGGIIERDNDGVKEILMQTRWKKHTDPLYTGTFEFPAGVLDKPYEDVHDTLAREIEEEAGLTLKAIKGDKRTKAYSPKGSDSIIGFQPFCCTQQLKDGKPWIGFIFICEVEPGEPKSQLSEAKDAKWMPVTEIRDVFDNNPEKLFGLEMPAWSYYFNSEEEK